MSTETPGPEAEPFEPQPFVRFPPFPKPPPGVNITPFKDFRAQGIQIQLNGASDAGPELDALGIPTVELRVKHETDETKTGGGGKKKRKKKKAGGGEGEKPKKPVYWWEIWEEAEDLRGSKVVVSR